jgi:oxygen-independent coproporphyrinogen-3 oxidase
MDPKYTFHAQGKSTALINRALEWLDAMNLEELHGNGYSRDTQSYAYVFQYPPTVALKEIGYEQLLDTIAHEKINDNKTNALGLYLHIPYCTGTCSYCYFTRYSGNASPIGVNEYLKLLIDDIEISKSSLYLENSVVTSIAFGGGTPTYMDGKDTTKLMSYIYSNFKCKNELEVSFEASPETITQDRNYLLSVLMGLGVNRLSIGIQSFNDSQLKLLNRRHDSKMAENAVVEARKAGFSNINLDLMYGLPGQSLLNWEQTLFKTTEVNPQSISLYRLRIHPEGKLANIKKQDFLDEYLFSLMYMMAVVHFTNNGYLQISSHVFVQSVDHIQKHVTEKQGINNCSLLGIGVSSYSYIRKCFFWKKFSMQDYREQIQNGKFPSSIGILLSDEEEKRKVMVLGLQEYKGVNREKYKEKFNEYPEVLFGEILKKLLDLKMIANENNHYCLTLRGYLFSDEICTDFYSKTVKDAIIATGVHRYGMNYIGKDYKKDQTD